MSKNLFNLFLVVLSFAIYYLVINPLYTGVGSVWQPDQGVTALSTLNSQYDDILIQASSLSTTAKGLEEKYISIPEDLKQKMGIMLPSSVDPVYLVSEINSIANKNNLTLGSISYNEKASPAGVLSSYVVSFSVKTTYDKFKAMMHDYETSLRLFTIKGVVFTVPEKEGDLIPFQVNLEAYYLK